MKNENNILLYTTPQGKINVSVRFENETFWLTQKAMATLFGVEVPAISKHLKKIYSEKELTEDTTISKMETVVNSPFSFSKKHLNFYPKIQQLFFSKYSVLSFLFLTLPKRIDYC